MSQTIQFSEDNNALEERPEGVTTKGNYWGWVSVKNKYRKTFGLALQNQTNKRGPIAYESCRRNAWVLNFESM